MRAKAHAYKAKVGPATFTSSTECIGLTGDFEGGLVLASVVVLANPGVGGWVSLNYAVDGVTQGLNPGAYQSGGSLQVAYTYLLRVPQGRHRINVYFGTSGTPIPSCQAELSVTELNA